MIRITLIAAALGFAASSSLAARPASARACLHQAIAIGTLAACENGRESSPATRGSVAVPAAAKLNSMPGFGLPRFEESEAYSPPPGPSGPESPFGRGNFFTGTDNGSTSAFKSGFRFLFSPANGLLRKDRLGAGATLGTLLMFPAIIFGLACGVVGWLAGGIAEMSRPGSTEIWPNRDKPIIDNVAVKFSLPDD